MLEQPSKLLKTLSEDAELNFFDWFGNIIESIDNAIWLLLKHPEYKEDIIKGKEKFYSKLKEFEESNYKPKGKINPESVKKLHDFKDLDWTKEETIEKIKKYLWSLRQEK